MPDDPDHAWLWLFSSNRRALYAQDISNVAALPSGARYTFRYRRNWVASTARTLWERNELKDRPVLIVFSYQHPEQFHPSAFVPVRAGRVVSSSTVGSFFTVEFEVADYRPLPQHRRASEDLPTMGERVREFSRAAETSLTEGYPGNDTDKSAVTASAPGALVDQNPPTDEAWERVVEHLAGSGAFPGHLFLRLLGVQQANGESVPCVAGRYELRAGDTYELRLAHYRPLDGDERRAIRVEADNDVLTIQGAEVIPVTSGYDATRLRFTARYRDEPIETVLALEPSDNGGGSRVEAKLRIKPPKTEKAFRMGLATLAIVVAAVPGTLKDFDGAARWWIMGIIALGGLIVGWSTVRSRIRLPSTR